MATRDTPAGVPLTSVQPDDYPRLSREGLGALKFNWRKANVKDDWTKGGSLSHAWDRVTGWPYWKKPSYDLDYGMRVLAKIAQEVPAWREVVGESAVLLDGVGDLQAAGEGVHATNMRIKKIDRLEAFASDLSIKVEASRREPAHFQDGEHDLGRQVNAGRELVGVPAD